MDRDKDLRRGDLGEVWTGLFGGGRSAGAGGGMSLVVVDVEDGAEGAGVGVELSGVGAVIGGGVALGGGILRVRSCCSSWRRC